MRDSHGVPLCRVIRYIYLARLIIDSNRWLLISYKQWLDQAQVSLVISMKQNAETWMWKDDTIDVDVNTDEVIMDTSSHATYDNVISTC